MRENTVSAREAGQRLDKYLAKYLPEAPKSFFYKMLRKKNITLNGKKAAGMEKLEEGDRIKLFLSEETIAKFQGRTASAGNFGDGYRMEIGFGSGGNGEFRVANEMQEISLDIVYEDEELLVVNKPGGMLSQRAGREDVSLVEHIGRYLSQEDGDLLSGGFRPGICNRLDRNTTGLVVAGKTVRSLQYMNRLFKERELKKYYLCLVQGKVTEGFHAKGYLVKDARHNRVEIGQSRGEGAVEIETAYEPLDYAFWQGTWHTLLRVHLITGKSHQIRAHLQSLGHPVAGDGKYGERECCRAFWKAFGLRYQLLHAWQLQLGSASYLPQQYRGMRLEAPLPELFQEILGELGMRLPEREGKE